VDNIPPTLVISAPTITDTNTGPVSYTVTYTGADTVSLATGSVTLNPTGTASGGVAISGTGTTTRTVTISNITGNGTIDALWIDAQGNQQESVLNVTAAGGAHAL
jgi:hypothetical protein